MKKITNLTSPATAKAGQAGLFKQSYGLFDQHHFLDLGEVIRIDPVEINTTG